MTARRTYRNIVELGQTTSSASYSTERDALVQDQTILILALQLDLTQRAVSTRFGFSRYILRRTSLGRSVIAPSFSKIPSVTMKQRVRGDLRFLRSLSTLSNTSSRLLRSLWSYQRRVDREIWRPFWSAKLTPLSATITSPR